MNDLISKKKKRYIFCSLDTEFHTYLLVFELNVLFKCFISLLTFGLLNLSVWESCLKLLHINLSLSCPINCHFVYFKMMISSAFVFIMTMYFYSIVTLISMLYLSLPLMVFAFNSI